MGIQLDPIFIGIVRYGEKNMTGYNTLQFVFYKRAYLPEKNGRFGSSSMVRPDGQAPTGTL
jgi:hypothetical protein